MGGNRTEFELTLKLDAGKITGTVAFGRGDTVISDGSFDAATGKVKLFGENDFSTLEVDATLTGDLMKGSLVAGGGRFTLEFKARRNDPNAAAVASGSPLESLVPGPRWVSSLSASRHHASGQFI